MKKEQRNRKIIVLIAIIVIAVIIAILITTNIIRNNKQVASEQYLATTANAGSSLVASYIKKGITIGGITGTLEVLDTSDATAIPEDITKGKTAYVNGVKITGTRVNRDMLKIGDYVEYTPDEAGNYEIESQYSGYTSNQTISQEELKWRIMSINNDGTVDLVGNTPATQTFNLVGGLGYNNAVYFMNDICKKFYSNSSLGVEGRALNIDDIHNNMSEEGITARDGYVGAARLHYGETEMFTIDREYPALVENEIGVAIGDNEINSIGVAPSNSYYSQPTTEDIKETDKLVLTQTWYGGLNLIESYFKSQEFFYLIFNADYSLASRQFYIFSSSNCEFRIATIYGKAVSGDDFVHDMFETTAITSDVSIKYRPVVTLNANVKFVEGDGTEENPYKLSL